MWLSVQESDHQGITTRKSSVVPTKFPGAVELGYLTVGMNEFSPKNNEYCAVLYLVWKMGASDEMRHKFEGVS